MKYTKEERLEIGRLIYTKQLTIGEAAYKYDLNSCTVRDYMRTYRDLNKLPWMNAVENDSKNIKKTNVFDYSDLENLTKEELIDEVIKAKVEVERAKKGYAVKGGGQEKEFISLKNQNSK